MGTERNPYDFSAFRSTTNGLRMPSTFGQTSTTNGLQVSNGTGVRLGEAGGFVPIQGLDRLGGVQQPRVQGSVAGSVNGAGGGIADLFSRGSPLIEGLNTFGNLANAYTSLRQMRLQKDAYNFNKALATTNLGNQATITNAAIDDRARAAGVQRGLEGETLDNFVREQNRDRYVRGSL